MNAWNTYLEWEVAVGNVDYPENMLADIERFLRDVHPTLPSGQVVYPEVFATNLFFPLQRQREMASMMRVAGGIKPRTVMEIGADKGGSLYHWCKCLPSVENVIACEIRGLPYAELFYRAFPSIAFEWLAESSRGRAERKVKRLLDGDGTEPLKIDVLFIDGDKSAFEADFDAYLPMMAPNGIVFLHDIQDSPGPGDAWERIEARNRWRTLEIVDVTESKEAVERENLGIPPSSPHESWLRHWKGESCGVGVVFLGGATDA